MNCWFAPLAETVKSPEIIAEQGTEQIFPMSFTDPAIWRQVDKK